MKSLYVCFVSLARSAHHEAMICHRLGDARSEAYWNAKAHDHMSSARNFKFFDCYSAR